MKFYVKRASVDYIIDMTPEENAEDTGSLLTPAGFVRGPVTNITVGPI